MGSINKGFSLLLIVILAASSLMMVESAFAENWVEVTRFTGSGAQNYTTNYFTCNNAEWRIRYEYVTNPQLSILTLFKVFILSLIHISEPTRRTPISYAVFCLKKK